MKKIFLIIAAVVLLNTNAHALILNGSFEAGYSNWTTLGVSSVETGAFGVAPTSGAFQSLISTAGTASDVAIETFLSLTPGTLDLLGNGNATSGSALRQTFNGQAGDAISFDWNFLTNEQTPSQFNDFSFFTLNSSAFELGDTFGVFSSSSTVFNEETGYSSLTPIVLPSDGVYTIGFGVIDSTDTVSDSGLLLDNISYRVNSNSGHPPIGNPSVPEPSTLLLLSAGSLGALIRRKFK